MMIFRSKSRIIEGPGAMSLATQLTNNKRGLAYAISRKIKEAFRKGKGSNTKMERVEKISRRVARGIRDFLGMAPSFQRDVLSYFEEEGNCNRDDALAKNNLDFDIYFTHNRFSDILSALKMRSFLYRVSCPIPRISI